MTRIYYVNNTVRRVVKTKRRALPPTKKLFAWMEAGMNEPDFYLNARIRRELERIEESLQYQVGDKELKETI